MDSLRFCDYSVTDLWSLSVQKALPWSLPWFFLKLRESWKGWYSCEHDDEGKDRDHRDSGTAVRACGGCWRRGVRQARVRDARRKRVRDPDEHSFAEAGPSRGRHPDGHSFAEASENSKDSRDHDVLRLDHLRAYGKPD